MFKAKYLYVILMIAYWFLAFFYLVSDSFYSDLEINPVLTSYILPYRYRMYTNPPSAEPKLTFVWYKNDSVLKSITPQDSLYKNWQKKPFSLQSKLLSNQVLGLYMRPLTFGKNEYQKIYLENYNKKSRWEIANQFKDLKIWSVAKENWIIIAKQQLQEFPVLNNSSKLILYYYISPYEVDIESLRLKKNFLPKGLVTDTIKMNEL